MQSCTTKLAYSITLLLKYIIRLLGYFDPEFRLRSFTLDNSNNCRQFKLFITSQCPDVFELSVRSTMSSPSLCIPVCRTLKALPCESLESCNSIN